MRFDAWTYPNFHILKPTYINMELPPEHLCLSDILQVDAPNQYSLLDCFGQSKDWTMLPKISSDNSCKNHWAWAAGKASGKIVKLVYNHVNHMHQHESESWEGWKMLWRLPVSPRIKTFLWRAFHGRLPTLELLYSLNIGPQELCPLCGLMKETVEHIMCNCNFARHCWELVVEYTGMAHRELDDLMEGHWLVNNENNGRGTNPFYKAVIATCAWKIWVARCDLIFNNIRPLAHRIVQQAILVAKDYMWKVKKQCREYLLTSFSNNYTTVMCDASWNSNGMVCGIGFIDDTINYAGCSTKMAESSLHAEVLAIQTALEQCKEKDVKLDRVCTDCIQAVEILTNEDVQLTLRLQIDVQNVKELIRYHSLVELDYCPRELNLVADTLARHSGNNHDLTLFHRGIDRPRWLEKIVSSVGLKF